jgi:1-acyl-sn-glycerol-3-phosphate acyltransferase
MLSKSVAVRSVAGFLTLWYGAAMLVFMKQERSVGWPKFERKFGFAMYGAWIFCGGSILQWLGLGAHLLCGEKVGRQVANHCQILLHRTAMKLFFKPVIFEGLENLPPGDEGCIYAMNHTSSVDMSICACLPTKPHLAAVAKKSIMVVPGIGPLTHLSGGIFVERSTSKKSGDEQERRRLAELRMQMLKEGGKARLESGISIGICPQGTRRVPLPGRSLDPFKRGAFAIADHCKARVVPVTALYPVDFMVKCQPLKMIIHPPITPKGDGDVDGLMKQVEDVVTRPILSALEVGGDGIRFSS